MTMPEGYLPPEEDVWWEEQWQKDKEAAREEVSEDEYVEGLNQFLIEWVRSGSISQADAEAIAIKAGGSLNAFGIIRDLPYFADIASQVKYTRAVASMPPIHPTPTGMPENFKKGWDMILASDLDYEGKKTLLNNWIEKANLPGGLYSAYSAKVSGDVFQSLPPDQMAAQKAIYDEYGFPQDKRVITQRQPELESVFGQEKGAMRGSAPWKEWFQSRYPTLLAQFQKTLPEGELAPQKMEENWRSYLTRQTPLLRQKWATQAPSQRYERPWSYQPNIKTVQF